MLFYLLEERESIYRDFPRDAPECVYSIDKSAVIAHCRDMRQCTEPALALLIFCHFGTSFLIWES